MTDTRRYTSIAIALHWLIGLMIIGNIVGGLIHDALPPDQKALVMGLHKSSGLAILLLSLLRLGWRLSHPAPPLPVHMTRTEVVLAKATHHGFYLLMILMPLTGWALTSAGTRPLDFFGLFPWPKLPVDAGARGLFHESHELIGWVMIATLALHVAAVVKHRWFDRDDVLARMLPGR